MQNTTEPTSTIDQSLDDDKKKPIMVAGLFLGAVLIAGFLMIMKLAQAETAAGVASWRDRISLIADSRVADASAWLNRHLNAVEELSDDASLQLYASMMVTADSAEAAAAQRGFVFSLLTVEADRTGFHENRALDQVQANVNRPRRAGLSVMSLDGISLIASTGMPALSSSDIPALDGRIRPFIILGPALEDKTPLVIFGAPVSAPEGLDETGMPVAWVIGARPLNEGFYKALVQPGSLSETAETYVVIAEENDMVTPITPLMHGGRLGATRQDEAAAFAAAQPGAFGEKLSYSGSSVFVTGREFSAPVSWILVRSVDADEALASIEERTNTLVISLSLAVLTVLALLFIVWRHGVSRRLSVAFKKEASLNAANAELSQFLASVSNSQPTAIAALDTDFRVHFANTKMADVTNIAVDDLLNRRLDTAFSGEEATTIREGVKAAAGGEQKSVIMNLNVGGEDQTLRTLFMPLENAGSKSAASALMVMQNITELLAAHKRGETLLKQLISTLTQIIDARDPWSKFHSVRVAEVAATIADEMGLDMVRIDTCQIAGQLVNLGKLYVPKEVLTKQGQLTDEEFAMVRESQSRGAELVKDLDFAGPVGRTLAEIKAHWDGSGDPKGLAGDDIEVCARILAVANTFVGMVSARAHREGFDFDKAIDFLQQDSGTKYERRVVAALQNILENKDGRTAWASYGKPVSEDASTE